MPSPAFHADTKYPPYNFCANDYVVIHIFETAKRTREYNSFRRLKRIKRKLGCANDTELRIMIAHKHKNASWGKYELFKDIK